MLQRFFSLMLVGLCILLIAADPQPKMINIVIITKEGKKLTGEMVNADENVIRFKPNPKTEDVTEVAWGDIKAVSNGITRQKVIEDVKKLFPDRKCETCKGEGTLKCEKCHGTGIDPATATDCETCKGAGIVGKCLKCKEGHIPCTGECIKETQFAGKPKDKDGKRWLQFHAKKGGGSLLVSDGHIGQVVVYQDGVPTLKEGMCPVCSGKGIIECPLCHGGGNKECPKCHGIGKVGPACSDCNKGQLPCKDCDGLGLKKEAPPQPPTQ